MTNNKISIIVPIYNAEDKLEKCINSIISQTYENIEIILVNDGSTDKSIEICKRFKETDERIIIINKENAGVSAARNSGMSVATGAYIQFVDSDDYINKNMCKRLISVIFENEADAVICGYNRVDEDEITKKFPLNNISKTLFDFKDSFSMLYEGALFNVPWNKLYKKEKINKFFKKDLSIGEDLLFNLSYFANCNRIATIRDCLYNYDVSSQETLASKYNENLFNIELMLHKEVETFFKNNFKADEDKCINRVFAKEVYYYLKKLVILSDENKKTKIRKIKDCIQNESVKKMLYNTDLDDTQIKIICFLLKIKMFNSVYVFFKLKEMISKKKMH